METIYLLKLKSKNKEIPIIFEIDPKENQKFQK